MEVTDGVFTIKFTAKVENPEINAIELIPEPSSATAASRVAAP